MENHINDQIKNIVVNSGLLFNLLLILNDQNSDSKMKSDI